MVNHAKLDKTSRDFFELVVQAVFLNPFSDERARVDALIAGDDSAAKEASSERVRRLLPRVIEHVERLRAQGIHRIDVFPEAEQELVKYAFLFDLFHRLIDDFDALIEAQRAKGATPLPVPFAKDALAEIESRGLPHDEALRYFALFYQLRRAFYFIEKRLIGCSPSMKGLRRALWNNVFTHDIRLYNRYLWDRMEDFATLLLGETGTGKGAGAAAIGQSGFIPFNERTGAFEASFTRNFVPINLSQYPESLIESELFGHRKGAFTGAVDDHDGVFARCSRYGSLFLDEIGEVSIPVQIKLLQVIQDRTFSPVGSHDPKRFEGRVIAATNRSIDKLRAEGKFRDDFFYRLCSDIIVFPTLRQRIAEDPHELDDLIAAVVQRMVGQPSPELVKMVRATLGKALPANYPWPGNVRELEQAVRRILLTQSYQGDLRAVAQDATAALLQEIEAGAIDAQDLLCRYCAMLYQRHGTYEEVARRTKLDRRTAKKYVQSALA